MSKLNVLFCKNPAPNPTSQLTNDVKNVTVSGNASYYANITISNYYSISSDFVLVLFALLLVLIGCYTITDKYDYCKPSCKDFSKISSDVRPVEYMTLAAFAEKFSKGQTHLGYKFNGDFRNHFLENVGDYIIHPDHLEDVYFILNQFIIDSSPKVKHVDRNFVRKLIEEVKKLD